MPRIKCYHCGAENDAEGPGSCAECGRRLPRAASFGIQSEPGAPEPPPRRPLRPEDRREREDRDPYASGPARAEAREAEQAARKKASGVLFGVAILQAVCGTAMVLLAPNVLGVALEGPELVITIILHAAIIAAFAGLGWWALYQPLPAAIVGLVLYVLLIVSDIAVSPEMAMKGIVVKIIIIVGLVQAIQAGAKASKLKQSVEYDSYD